jgi:hypothetical protein
MGLIKTHEARERSLGLDRLEIQVSGQLVGIIDILLGLTLVEGALSFTDLFKSGADAPFIAYVGVVLVYYTTIRSFIDWHIAMEVRPYRVLTKCTRTWELSRVLLDFLIMFSYSFLLLRVHALIDLPATDLTSVAIIYVWIYVAYIIWGCLREHARAVEGLDPKPFGGGLLWSSMVLAIVLLALYLVGRDHRWLGDEGLNIALLFSELALMLWYRHKNWRQQLTLLDQAPRIDAAAGGAA